MKANKPMTALLFLNLMTSMTTGAVTAAEAKGEAFKHNGENGMRVNMHGRDDSEVLWTADPKQGWVPTKEKHQKKNQDHVKQQKQNNHAAKH